MPSGPEPRESSDRGRAGPEPSHPSPLEPPFLGDPAFLEASLPRLPWIIAIALGLVISGTGATGQAQLNPGAAAPPLPAEAGPPRSRPAALGRPVAVFLIRSVLMALHQANQTGNYTVLR